MSSRPSKKQLRREATESESANGMYDVAHRMLSDESPAADSARCHTGLSSSILGCCSQLPAAPLFLRHGNRRLTRTSTFLQMTINLQSSTLDNL